MPNLRRALLVKDDPDQVTLFTLMLAQVGYDVAAVPSAETALTQSVTPPFDLLLTDLHLTGIKGNELIRAWQYHSPTTRTILMSGDSCVKTIAAACHADGWFRKPVEIAYFSDIITSVAACPSADRGCTIGST